MNILQVIFKDHYEEMLYILHPRQAVIKNVDKMINCGDPSFGGAMYGCTKCGNMKFVPFRCKSRFCPTCGVKYCQDRSNAMSFKLIQCTHRHCVFTIDEDLRHFFLEDRPLLDCLFNAVRSVVLRMFHHLNKSKNFVPVFICVLHTFGRPLEWNPHIHCLITEGGFSDDGFWRVVKHFDYSYLRKAFQTALLNLLFCLFHTIYINRQKGFKKMDPKSLEELRNKYIQNPPEGMTAELVKGMTDSDLLDMHYFLTEDDDWDGNEPEEGFYIDIFQ